MRNKVSRSRFFAAIFASLLLAGCGGGTVGNSGGGGGGGNQVSISILPTMASVQVAKTQPFAATVSGSSNTAVSYFVNNVAGGNATVGTISSSGTYTAPATLPNPATVTVIATAVADSTKSATAQVTVTAATQPPPAPVVTSITSPFVWGDAPATNPCFTVNGSGFTPNDTTNVTPGIVFLPPPTYVSPTQFTVCPVFDTPDFAVSFHAVQRCNPACSANASFGFLGDGQNTLVGTPDGGFLNLDQGQGSGVTTNAGGFVRVYDTNLKLLQSVAIGQATSAIAFDKSSQAILSSTSLEITGVCGVGFNWLDGTPGNCSGVSGSTMGVVADGNGNGCVAQPVEGKATGFPIGHNILNPKITSQPAGTEPWAAALYAPAGSNTYCAILARGNDQLTLFALPSMAQQGQALLLKNLTAGGDPSMVTLGSGTAAGTAAIFFPPPNNVLVFVNLSTMQEIRRVPLTSTGTSTPIQIVADETGALVIVAYGDVSNNGQGSTLKTVSVSAGDEVALPNSPKMPILAGGLGYDGTKIIGVMGMGASPATVPYP